MIKNIIFDFDGVLVDSEMLVAKSFSKYLANNDIHFKEKDFSVYAGMKTAQVIDELSNKFNIPNKKKFFEDILDIANNIYSQELEPIKGAKEFINKNNYNFLIGSNSIKERILFGLRKVKFDKFFDENKIFSFDMVKEPKPHPDVYLTAIKVHNLDKEETLILEDSSVGVKAGVAAGVKVIGLTAGGHWHAERPTKELLEAGAYIVVSSYESLLEEILNL